MTTSEAILERSSIGIGRSIRMLWTLYMKDLRRLADICLSLIALSVVWQGITTVTHIRLYGVPPNAISFMFPTILAYYLYANRAKGSAYLQQSLPLSPGLSILTLYGALLTYVWAYVLIAESIDALTDIVKTYHLYHTVYQTSQVTIRYGENADVTISYWQLFRIMLSDRIGFSIIIEDSAFYSGIVCLAAGITRPAAGSFRGRYWAGFIVVFMLAIAVLALFNRFGLQWYSVFGRHTYVLLGVLFAFVGALYYSHHGEV